MSVKPAPIYASSTLKSPPPGSINTNNIENNNNNNNNNCIDNDDDMIEIDDDEMDPRSLSNKSSSVASSVPLVLAPAYILPLGCRVVMGGLIHTTKLNGHLGIVEEYISDSGRYKIRPLGRAAKRLTKYKFVSIRPNHLTKIDDTTFIVNLTIDRKTGKQHKLPLRCNVFWSNEPNPQDQQLIVQLLYSNVWKNKKQLQQHFNNGSYVGEIATTTSSTTEENSDPNNSNPITDDKNDDVFLDSVNTRIDYEEHVSEDQWLDGYEILILTHKPMYGELYDAMVDYEIIEELEDLKVCVGLNGDVPLCKLKCRFPKDEYSNYDDTAGGGAGGDGDGNTAGVGKKQNKEKADGPGFDSNHNKNVGYAAVHDDKEEVVDESSANKKRKGRE